MGQEQIFGDKPIQRKLSVAVRNKSELVIYLLIVADTFTKI